MTKTKNTFSMLILSLCLGAVVGLVLWLFLRAVSVGTSFVWDKLSAYFGTRWVTVPLCALGGCFVGILHRLYGDYPEELDTVLGKVKREKHYDYHPMLVMLISALLPLVFGSSVGPEAGLTGIIAALCYWIGDNVSFARQNAAMYSELGEAVTLGQVFHMPLFGIFAVEETPGEDGQPPAMPKFSKLVYYGLAAASGFFVIRGLNSLLATPLEGFPSFSEVTLSAKDYALALVYIPVGVILYILYEWAEKLTKGIADHLPVILRETLCGIVIGLAGLAFPVILFSGEEQMAELMDTWGSYVPWMLIGICLLKIVMTAFCLRFGMKGGHFFPLIFACTCMGIGLAMLIFAQPESHIVFAAGVVTAATLGAQMKKPFAVSILMLLCFPVRLLFWIFLAAALGGRFAQIFTADNNTFRGKEKT